MKKETRSEESRSTRFLAKLKIWRIIESGDDGVEETLLPIPNRKVKLYSVDGTARGTVWESRTLPGKYASLAQLVEHLTLNQGVPGSIP